MLDIKGVPRGKRERNIWNYSMDNEGNDETAGSGGRSCWLRWAGGKTASQRGLKKNRAAIIQRTETTGKTGARDRPFNKLLLGRMRKKN